jgi:tetratricopeptide (TPR) repeat protein
VLVSEEPFWYISKSIFKPRIVINNNPQKDKSMKHHVVKALLGIVLASFMFQGYQCGSPEFTGAKVYITQKNYKEAIRMLEIEVKKNPTNEEAWYFLGSLRGDEGNYKAMNKAFAEVLKLSNKHASEIRAIRYNHWGQNLNAGVGCLEKASSDSAQYFNKALNSFTRSIEAWPDTALTYRYLAYAYYNKGEYNSALTAFQQAWDMGKDVESIKRAGRIYIMKGDDHKKKFEEANAEPLRTLKNLEDVKKTSQRNDLMQLLGPPDTTVKGPRGTRKEDWVYKKYKLTVSIDGEKVVDRKFGQPVYKPEIDSTEYRMAQAEFVKADNALEIARAADPKDNETLQALLKAYVESNRIKPAISVFEKEVKDSPENKQDHYILGVLYRTDGRFDDAIAQFKEVLRIDPSDCDTKFDLAATYYNWGVDIIHEAEDKAEQTVAYKPKFEAALPYMEQVTECKKDDPNIWETLGQIYARLDQQDKAMKAFQQADKVRKGQ